jgi:hypothetical protein
VARHGKRRGPLFRRKARWSDRDIPKDHGPIDG